MKLLSHTYESGNASMHYLEGGKGSTIIFIHGVGLEASTYQKSLSKLAEHFHIIAPDIFGFGKSDMLNDQWNFAWYGAFLEKFLISKKIRSATLVGHSLGGRIAVNIASTSKIAHKLVLIDSSPFALELRKERFHDARLVLNTLSEFLLNRNLRYVPVLTDVIKNLPTNPSQSLALRRTLLTALLTDDYQTGTITIPVLILWGQKDRVVPLRYAQALSKVFPHATLQIVPGDHIWCITHPELLLDTIRTFIQK